MSKLIKTTTMLFVTLFSLSTLFAQYGADKYGSKGAPKTQIPKTWTTADDSRSEDYILGLFDSWGDGWDGASLDLYVNGTLIGDDLTVDTDVAAYYFTVADGDFVETIYTSGSYESEHSYAFYDHFGVLIAEDGPSPGAGISFTVDNTNMLVNGSFEHHTLQGNGWQYHADNWEFYPDGDHYNVEMDGSTVYNSDAIFNTYDGTAAVKMWGNDGENNLFETYWGTLPPGTEFDVSAMFWQHQDDDMNDDAFVVVMAKYFDGGWGWLGMDSSSYYTTADGYETWTSRQVSCVVPDGAEIVQVGIMYVGGGGGVYVDDVYMEPPATTNNDNVTIVCDGGSYQSEVSWSILDDAGTVVATGGAPYSGAAELQDGEYTVNGYDAWGDGWNGNYLTVTDENSDTLIHFTLETGSEASATFSFPYEEPVDLVDVYFSEYAEGSSNNKYLEVYNGTGAEISLGDYVILGNYNGNPWSEAFTFAAGATLAAGDVYVIANSSATDAILALADEALAYGDPWYTAAFNGDDVRALAQVSGTDTTILDIIGTLDFDGDGVEGEGAEDDPGGGFDVAGVSEATKDHTLVRQESQIEGNGGDWAISAGTDEFNSEYSVEERPTADYTPSTLGWHINEPSPPCDDTELTINMYDSYGDGWNGNILMIGDLSYTIETGDFNTELACLMDGSYSVTCDGGAYQGEVSWEIIETSTGTVLLAGGAPYSGVLQIGETTDILGCMDPSAVNYNPDATVDDGSCYYAGDSCSIALDFAAEGGATDGSVPVVGATEYAYDADWYYFVLDEAWDYLRISLTGSDFDTKLEVWDECDDASYVAYNDDANGTLQSEVILTNVTAGDGYVKVYGYGSGFGNYVLTIEAYNNPTSPTNLTAEGSLELVSLAWDPYVPAGRSGPTFVAGDIPSNIADDNAAYSEKKEEYLANHPELIGSPRFHSFVNEDYSSNSRSTDVVITCDGGSWQSEVSWEIHDAGGTVVAAGGAPASLEASLDDGVYTAYGWDAFGDGWNGNYLNVSGTDGTVYLDWTVEGSEGTTQFSIGGTEQPDLSLTDIWYDYDADAVMVNVANTGNLAAGGFYITFYLLNATNGECGNADYEAYAYVEGLAAGESLDTGVGPGLLDYIGGYGDYNFGAFADWQCIVEESDETNNTYEEDITLTDPLAGTTWNVYRSDGGAAFAQVGTAETDPSYADPFPGTDGLTEYCYYVTQIMDDATESGSSNEACATPIAPVALPTPTELVGEADGWQVNLSWTAPDLSNYDPGMAQSFAGDKEDDPSTYVNYDPSDYPDMTRQGGDTDADATVVDGLPYNDTGTTDGYTDDYDEACPYSGSTSPDVVYSFTSDADVIMSVDLCSDGNQYDTKTYVYENAMGTLAGTVSLGANSACNDDFCSNAYTGWASFIGDVIVTAGNTYYIVIDGYGGGSGNYDLTLADATPSPVLSYNVYRDGAGVGSSDGVNNTEWSEFLAEEGTYDYSVTAVYDIYGESGPSNTASVEVTGEAPSCNAPQNLTAIVEDNDVSLMWEEPEGTAGSVITYFNGTYYTNVGTNGAATFEAAVIFTPEQLQSYDGMSLTTVSFIPGEVDAVYTVMIYDVSSGTPVAVDSSGAYSGADLVIGEFNDVDLANPITIDWTQNLSFGYKCVTNAGYPLGCDDGPATPGYSDLLNFGGWVSMADAYGLNYNWAISGEVNNAGNGRSLASMDPIDVYYPKIQTGELSAQTLPVPIPIEISTPSTRDLVEYNVYRDAEQIGTSAELGYSDMDVAVGVHTYFVTALYDDSEDCGESEPSNEVEVEVVESVETVTITIDLYDSYGDGWNGGILNVAGSDYTIDAGDFAQFFMDLAEGTHSWWYTPGSWPEENSWVVSADGNILFEGTGPDEQGGTFTIGGVDITAIYDIQYSTDAENGYPSPLIGQEVSIVGVVTAVKYNGINVQDDYGEWSGIWVYSGTGSTDYISVGDLYQVTGTVDEYNLLTELVCGAEDLTYLGSDYYVDPVVLESTNSANNEALEGVFVNVNGVCIDDDVSDYGQWAIDDGTGPVQVEDHYVSYQPTLGYSYDLTGPMGESSFDTTYEIGPSDSASIVETPPCEGIQADVVCDYGAYQSEVSWFLIDNGTADTVLAGGAPAYLAACMYDGSYTLEMHDAYGDGWNGNMWEIWIADSLVFSATLESGTYGQASFIFGETEDVLGCTDPEAINYNPDATLDDGSCYYAGDSCSIALDAVVGLNPATGADQWFSYTATMSGSILATTCYEGQCEDTKVEIFSACPEDGGTVIAESDDAMCMDATGCTNYASEVEFECVAGVTYYFFWDDFWGPGAYEWLLDESPPPSSPQNLEAAADLELITLTWEGLDPDGRSGSSFQDSPTGSNIVDDYNQSLEKKENHVNRTPIRSVTLDKVYSYAQLTGRNNASRDASVIMTLYDSFGDGYGGTGYITDTSGTTIYAEFPGGWTGYESAYGPYDLADGLYMVWFEEATWAYETTWELTDASDSTAVIASGSVESPGYFAIGENAPMANLSFTDIWYDHEGDAVMTELINDGDMDAGGFYVVYYLTYPTNDTCGNAYYDGYVWVDGIPQGGTTIVGLGPGILDYVGGYGTYTFGAFADYLCAVSEIDETDNTIEETMTLSDPNEGIVWNIYRSDDGADFAMLGTSETDPTYADPFPGTDGLTEYCYYVTQIMGDETESDTSNHACAAPIAPVDLPVPTDLVGEADGWQVNLSWTPPDLSGFDPELAQSSAGDKEDDPSTYINYDPSDYSDMTRQGGDTDADATVVDGLPYSDTGTTTGYTDDYDEVCPYAGSTSPDVVYSFTPDADGIMSVDLCSDGNQYDTKTYVYENDMGNLAGTVALGPNSACNDDFCANAYTSWASFIADVIVTAGNTYYIVIDGYGGAAGAYDLFLDDVAPPSPLLGYNVYRDDVIVGNADGDADQYTEFVTEVGTYDYFLTAVYETYGESDPSNTVSVEVEGAAPTCNAPQNLTAESMGNDVSLSWEAPAGGSGWLHHDNGESTNSIGTGAAAEFSVAARFGPEHLMDYNGMSLTQIQFVHAVTEASYQVVVWTAEVGGAPNVIAETDWIPGTDLPIAEWNVVELTEAITIDWSQDLWFGYNINTPSGYPAGCDSGPMVPGYGAKILWGGEWFDLTELNAALDYNWSIQGFVDSSPGRSIASLGTIDSPTVGLDPDAEFNAQRFPEPIEVTTPLSRSLVNYNIYRDGEYFMSTTPEMTAYDDMDAPWGSHVYFVTAFYDDSEACGESDPSNEVEVYLENGAPLGFSLISPPDGFEVFVNEDNQDEQVAFIWTASADPDNDLVQYFLVSEGAVGEDTVENVYPGNELGNSGFEDGSDGYYYPVGWDMYPDYEHHMVMETGFEMYGGPPYTFEAYEGDHSLLIWGLYNGVQGNENNVYQTWYDGSLEPGTEFSVNAWMMTNEYNSLSQGDNYAVLFAKYFGAGWSWIGMETSAAFDGTYSDNDWHNFQFDATVPDGAEIVQVGVMIVQADDNSHGTVYVDAFHMHMPMLQTGLFIPYGEMAEDALEDSVSTVVYLWDVWAWDGWDGTPSNDGPRTLTVDVSALLGIDGDGFTPDVFALHNNYPNPFNPITNITYDIPEVSDVTLEVFNVAGQKVRTLVQKTHEPGRYRVVWGATNDYGQTLSSGMYFYRIQAGDFVSVKKLILMK